MTSGIASKGVDLDSIFDPYQAGTTKARAAGLNVAGSDTSNRFANIIYGTAAAATGIQSEGADINTLYAAKGTAKYNLPVNGQTYSAIANSSGVAPIKEAQGSVSVQVGGGQYNVQTSVINNGGTAVVTNYNFTIPAGMNYFYMTLTNPSIGTGGAITNPPAGWTAIPGSLTTEAKVQTTNQVNNGTQITQATANLYFGASSGATVWAGSFTIHSETDISA